MAAADSTLAILAHLAGGVALLVWAVRLVRTGAMRAFGASLRQVLSRFTRNRWLAFGSGAGVTLVLQSATATTLILSSFAGRALISLPMALAVVLGADVGSTLAAQLVSLNLGWVWGPVVALGVMLYLASEASEQPRNIGRVLVGLGLILLSLVELKTAAAPLGQSPTFRTLLGALGSEPLLAVLVAAGATWLTHSSLAIVLLVMSFAATGLIDPPLVLALVIGANLGGALVPLIDQMSAPVAQKRVALGNLLMRGLAALMILPFLAPLARWFATLGLDSGRFAVDAHLLFNLAVAAVFLPLVGPVARLIERLMPDVPGADVSVRPRYLDAGLLDNPPEALACAMRETLRLGDRVDKMLKDTMTVFERDDIKLAREIENADDGVDTIHEAIKLYLVRLSGTELSEAESSRLVEIITLTTNLEHIGDIIDKNLIELAEKKVRKHYSFSEEGMAEIRSFHQRITDSFSLAMNVFATRDIALARRLFAEKPVIREAERQATESHYERLRSGRAESIETSSIHLDVIRDLKRIHGHITSAAYPILENAGELSESRLQSRSH